MPVLFFRRGAAVLASGTGHDPMTRTDSNIERLERPTREFLRENYVDKNRPVILTGVASEWPARTKWTAEYLAEVGADSPVTVHFNDHGNFHDWYTTSARTRVDQRVPFRELVRLLSDEKDARYYMTEHELRKVSPRLLEDIDLSAYIDQDGPFEVLLFLGCDTCMPLHYHGTTEAMLCQLYGEKEVTLFGPSEWSRLYPRPWFGHAPLFSQVDGSKPDLGRFPRYDDAEGLRFTLHPGEILFIPVHWWHLTRVEGFQVSVTQFWKAELSNWRFPNPGLQVIAREALFRTKSGLRRVRARLRGAG